MLFRFLSNEWIVQLSRLLNESPSYESSAKDWEGELVFVVEPGGDSLNSPTSSSAFGMGRAPVLL